MPEDLDRSARDDLDDPVFPYPHLNATLTSWESFLDVVAASEDEIVEDARKIMQQMLSTRIKSVSHGVLLLGGFCGTWAIVFAGARSNTHSHSRGEEHTVVVVRQSSRGPGAIRMPGSRG